MKLLSKLRQTQMFKYFGCFNYRIFNLKCILKVLFPESCGCTCFGNCKLFLKLVAKNCTRVQNGHAIVGVVIRMLKYIKV